MLANKPLPAHSDLKPYSHAVAGHDGTLCDPDGELFIKPCVQDEIDFYESARDGHKAFAKLMPKFYGTLCLSQITDAASLDKQVPEAASHMTAHFKEEAVHMAMETVAVATKAAEAAKAQQENIVWKENKTKKIATNTSVVLENLAYGFEHPNILDAKLGKRLWADDAPEQKKVRFDQISRETTNGSHGFRVAGMRVYKGTDKEAALDEEKYLVYGKDYGRKTVNSENIDTEMRKFIFNTHAGIDDDSGRYVASKFLEDLKQVEKVLEAEESRMYSASLLFTFEGCGEALRRAINETRQRAPTTQHVVADMAKQPKIPDFAGSRIDSGIVLDDEDGEIVLQVAESELSPVQEEIQAFAMNADTDVKGVDMGMVLDMDEDDDYYYSDDDEMSSMPKVYSLKLIDFAHARWLRRKAGSAEKETGPDTNVLMGVKSLIAIFEKLSK
ncbi:inositol polyphosphate kinase-domain-containing protein [Schizothecium vesticola]|uniref:Kinase n=1 Tax=Schizothecium vesticola TaxID=314040 RepID=A0AA40ER85_9PEZI|nr:inositol polyphosphate kinase-domain-containing protein [Schizothecium vesticola]